MATYEVEQSFRDYDWYWHLVSSNGRVMADGAEGYSTKQACLDGIALVKAIAATAVYHWYVDARGEYRWRLRASNGRIIADSGEGYTTEA